MVLLLLLALTHGFPTPAATSAPTSAPTPAPKVEYCDDASLVGCEHQQCLVDNTPGCLGATMKSRFGRGASPAAATAGKDKRKAVRIEARGRMRSRRIQCSSSFTRSRIVKLFVEGQESR